MIGKQLMGLYFAHTSLGSTYSAAGSPIVVLLWVYYSAQLLFWGAEFSKVYAKTVGSNATGSIESAGAGAAGDTGTGGLPHPYFPNCRTTYHARGSPSTRLESTSC